MHNALTIRLANACAAVIPAEQALELARNLACAALLGPLESAEWAELVDDALRARQTQRAGSAWLLAPTTVAGLRVALLAVAV